MWCLILFILSINVLDTAVTLSSLDDITSEVACNDPEQARIIASSVVADSAASSEDNAVSRVELDSPFYYFKTDIKGKYIIVISLLFVVSD